MVPKVIYYEAPTDASVGGNVLDRLVVVAINKLSRLVQVDPIGVLDWLRARLKGETLSSRDGRLVGSRLATFFTTNEVDEFLRGDSSSPIRGVARAARLSNREFNKLISSI